MVAIDLFPTFAQPPGAGYNYPVPSYHCPTCNKILAVEKKEAAPFRPFCCKRCKMIDLGRWLDGTYAITEDTPASSLSEEPDDATN